MFLEQDPDECFEDGSRPSDYEPFFDDETSGDEEVKSEIQIA